MPDTPWPTPESIEHLRAICRALPETTTEPPAWIGERWAVRGRNFAHLVGIENSYPPSYARASGLDGPADVLTFRSFGEELAALTAQGHPFFRPRWAPGIVGLRIGPDTDWDEVAELVTESYRLLAPAELVRLLDEQLSS